MTELITEAQLDAAEKRRTDAAVAYQVQLQTAAAMPLTSDGTGELQRLRAASELSDLRLEHLRQMYEDQQEAISARAERETECAAELAGLAAELSATWSALVKRSIAAQSAMAALLDTAREWTELLDRAGGALVELGLGPVPGEVPSQPLGRSGVRLAGSDYLRIDPSLLGAAIAARAANAALGTRDTVATLAGKGPVRLLLEQLPAPKATAPPPPVRPDRPRFETARVVRDRNLRSVIRYGDAGDEDEGAA